MTYRRLYGKLTRMKFIRRTTTTMMITTTRLVVAG